MGRISEVKDLILDDIIDECILFLNAEYEIQDIKIEGDKEKKI